MYILQIPPNLRILVTLKPPPIVFDTVPKEIHPSSEDPGAPNFRRSCIIRRSIHPTSPARSGFNLPRPRARIKRIRKREKEPTRERERERERIRNVKCESALGERDRVVSLSRSRASITLSFLSDYRKFKGKKRTLNSLPPAPAEENKGKSVSPPRSCGAPELYRLPLRTHRASNLRRARRRRFSRVYA